MLTIDHITSILGGAAALYELARLSAQFLRSRVSFSWRNVENWIDSLYNQFVLEQVLPDLIVGLGRGGAVVAGLISTKFRDDAHRGGQVVPIATLDRVYVKTTATVNGIRSPAIDTVIAGIHNLEVHGKRVLLLNADSYSGTTLFLARQILEYATPKQLWTGSLVAFAPRSGILDMQPDFIGARLPARHADRRLPWRRLAPRAAASSLPPATLVVLNGLVATGKTSVANSLVTLGGFHPVYSDWYWFSHGLRDRETNELTNYRHYQYMLALCWSALAMGCNVVLDTTSRWRATRDEIHLKATRYGIKVVFVRCRCPEAVSRERIRARRHIGPHDFGTDHEYDRIKADYEDFSDQELKSRNIVDIDTETMNCYITNLVKDGNLEVLEREIPALIVTPITHHYFAKISAEEVP